MLLRSRLLRSLVSFADLCLLEVLWWIYAYPFFSFFDWMEFVYLSPGG